MRPEPYAWSLHPEATLAIVVLGLAYVLVSRAHKVSRWRVGCWSAGIALLLATAVTPLDPLSYHLLSIHLLQNVVLAEWAPALLVLGLPAALARRLPVPPLAGLAVWLAVYGLWHVPAVYDAALRNPALLHLEHASYLVAGIAFWLPLLHRNFADSAKALYLLTAFVLVSPIGLLLALLPEPAYGYYEDGPGLWGLSPLEDQQLAGLTMAGEQSVVFFAAFLVFLLRFLRAEEQA